MMKIPVLKTERAALLLLLAALAAALFAAPSCNKASGSGGEATGSSGSSKSSSAAEGKEIFMAQGCNMCHGDNMEGKDTVAPALSGIAANWTAEKLTQYLKDPQGYADKDPRLSANREHFSMRMPPYQIKPEEEAMLIAFLLTK